LIFWGPGFAIETLSVRSECQRNRYKLRVRSMEGLGIGAIRHTEARGIAEGGVEGHRFPNQFDHR